jgi:hypothetical protein
MYGKSKSFVPDTAATAQSAVQPRFGEVHIRRRGRLPHWEKDGGLYFITFLLADSLPKTALNGWKSFTARKTNAIHARKGAFWQREYRILAAGIL